MKYENDTIGIHYELPDGKIAYVCGWHGKEGKISYYFNGDTKTRKTSINKWNTWKPRRDLKDFPNAVDPRLPHVFDLFWDLKHKSQLEHAISGNSDFSLDEVSLIKEKMQYHNITLE